MKPDNDELLAAGEIRPHPDWRMPPHFHPHHELIIIKSGSILLKTKHGESTSIHGDIFFYESGLVHEEISRADGPVDILFIAFQAGELLPFPLRMHDSDGRVTELLSWLVRDHRQGRPLQDCKPLLEAVINELKWLQTRPQNPWLEQILNYMLRSLADPLSLETIARRAGMSRFAFLRKFKRLVGRTPMEELRLMRLNEARNLILSSGLPLKAIAPAVGIGDEFQLSKLLHRYFGISARDMRSESRISPAANHAPPMGLVGPMGGKRGPIRPR